MILALLKVYTRILYGSMLLEEFRVSTCLAMLYGGVCVDTHTWRYGASIWFALFRRRFSTYKKWCGIFLPPSLPPSLPSSVSSPDRSYLEGGGECFVQQLQRVSIMVSCALMVPIAGDMCHHARVATPPAPRPLPLQHMD